MFKATGKKSWISYYSGETNVGKLRTLAKLKFRKNVKAIDTEHRIDILITTYSTELTISLIISKIYNWKIENEIHILKVEISTKKIKKKSMILSIAHIVFNPQNIKNVSNIKYEEIIEFDFVFATFC